MKINENEIIVFKPKTKAAAEEVNANFETLRLANNELEDSVNQLKHNFDDYKSNELCEIKCDSEILELNETTNNFKVSGTSSISEFTGILNGFVFIEFDDSRVLINNPKLKLQNNVDRITKACDIGIYLFREGIVKEVNFFTSKEEKTNTLPAQTIIDCPKDKTGKSNFIKKIEFSKDIMPVMEDFENEVCIVSSSSQHDAVSFMPWKAFRHHTNDVGGWLTVEGVTTGWLKIEFRTSNPKLSAFSITARNATDSPQQSPCDFVIEGSNDDKNWTLLGDYKNNLNWKQNEKRYFALTYFDNFKFYRITVNKNAGTGTCSGFGALELFETLNDFMPMTAKLDLSNEKPLLINTGVGKSSIGKVNQLSIISNGDTIENLYNNSLMYAGYIKNSENRFETFVTTACPVYSSNLQRYSNKNSVPIMISDRTSKEFKYGYVASASSISKTNNPYLAFNGAWNDKWVASVAGGNQWLQIEFPNYRKAARFTIAASSDEPGGSVKTGFIKGFNGEEWVVLKEIKDEINWTANEVRHFDADIIDDCNQFKLEITEVQDAAKNAQVAEFQIYELANCFVIPENKFYSYNIDSEDFEEKEIIYIGRLKTQNNFITDAESYAAENKYISDEIDLAPNTLYSFFHNIGVDYKNLKVSGWIKDKVNGFILPWSVDSNIDSNVEYNNYGYYVDDCQFNVRTPATIMNYKDYNNVTRAIKANVSLVLQIERNF